MSILHLPFFISLSVPDANFHSNIKNIELCYHKVKFIQKNRYVFLVYCRPRFTLLNFIISSIVLNKPNQLRNKKKTHKIPNRNSNPINNLKDTPYETTCPPTSTLNVEHVYLSLVPTPDPHEPLTSLAPFSVLSLHYFISGAFAAAIVRPGVGKIVETVYYMLYNEQRRVCMPRHTRCSLIISDINYPVDGPCTYDIQIRDGSRLLVQLFVVLYCKANVSKSPGPLINRARRHSLAQIKNEPPPFFCTN